MPIRIRRLTVRAGTLLTAAAVVSAALAAPAAAATDTAAPALAATVGYAPDHVDITSADATSTVSVTLTDDTGVESAVMSVPTQYGPSPVELALSSGTPTRGVWSGTQSFSPDVDTAGVWKPTNIVVTDTLNNSATITNLGGGVTVDRTIDSASPLLAGVETPSGATPSIDTTADDVDVPVRVHATDDLSGVSGITVTFTSPDGDSVEGDLPAGAKPVQGTRADGYWDVPVTFAARSTSGVWRLSAVAMSDAQYNNSRFDDTNTTYFSALPVQVRSDVDTVAPGLTSLKIGPARRTTGYGVFSGNVFAQIGFTDAVSGLATVQVVLQRPDGTVEDSFVQGADWAYTDAKSGTSRSGTMTVPIWVDNFYEGTWRVASLQLTDQAGNTQTLTGAGLGTSASFAVSTARTDTANPVVGNLAFSPEVVDARGGRDDSGAGAVLVTASDPDAVSSGIVGGSVTLTASQGSASVSAPFTADDLVAGDPTNGTFRAAFTLPDSASDGDWSVTAARVDDAAAHSGTTLPASLPTLTVIGVNHGPASPPDAPVISDVLISGTAATVRWNAPAANGAPITAYRVTPSEVTDAGVTVLAPVTVKGTAARSATVSGLRRGLRYNFVVAATNAAGTGTASEPSATVQATAAAPDSPVAGRAEISGTTATVSWGAPAADGGAEITGYRVTPSLVTGTSTVAQPAIDVAATARTATITGLARGRSYVFHVAAVNQFGAGSPSLGGNAVTVAVTAPAAPRVTAARAVGTSAVVSWQAPVDDGGAKVTGYRVTGSPAGTCATTTATSCTVSGLRTSQRYTFTVRASNTAGTGAASAPSAAVAAQLASHVAITSLPASVGYGHSATVTGRIGTRTAAGVRGVGVRLQYLRSGSRSWTTSGGTVASRADGTVRFAFKPSTTVRVRLVTVATPALTASSSSWRTIGVTRQVTIGHASTRGGVLHVSGRATPARSGSLVTLQRYSHHAWRGVASSRVSHGAYSFTARPQSRGRYPYRVVARADSSYATSASATRTLRLR